MRFIWGFLTALILLVVGALGVTFLGAYNVAANVPDNPAVAWLLSTNMKRSVVSHASAITTPARLTDQQARDAARIYKETCVYCHGAPGKDPGDICTRLNPDPPYLPDTVAGWTSSQLFWIIKNGIKMTGMASYGAVHKDEEIWKLVAFVQRLPKMTPEEYGRMEQASAGGG